MHNVLLASLKTPLWVNMLGGLCVGGNVVTHQTNLINIQLVLHLLRS